MKEKIAKAKEELKATVRSEEILVGETSSPLETEDSGIASETVSQEVIVVEKEVESEIKEPSTDEVAIKIDPEPMEVESTLDEVKVSDEAAAEEIQEVEPVQETEKEEELTPFQELIRVASLLNPKQFDLPVDMTEPFPFPGTERVEQIKNGRRVKNKRLIELDVQGCVPLPAKLCYACSRSCKKAPLISCDYCSLFFHQDCLDPPMTALPAGRWMCPNHPQHFIVSFVTF